MSIVTESVFLQEDINFPSGYLSEKIWKPIGHCQPFILAGPSKSLQHIKERFGYKTFHPYIDESYDLETDPARRIDKIVELCHWLKQQDWRVLYAKTEHIRKHNAQLFFNKTSLQGSINKTLLGLLKSFDSSQISS